MKMKETNLLNLCFLDELMPKGMIQSDSFLQTQSSSSQVLYYGTKWKHPLYSIIFTTPVNAMLIQLAVKGGFSLGTHSCMFVCSEMEATNHNSLVYQF